MVTHATYRRQLLLALSLILTLGAWVLVHDVCKIDPLVPTAVTVLRRVGLGAWDRLPNSTHSLSVIGTYKHGWFSMACT
jgi:hypothetical protein